MKSSISLLVRSNFNFINYLVSKVGSKLVKNIYTMDAETRGLYRKAHSIESQDAPQNNLS